LARRIAACHDVRCIVADPSIRASATTYSAYGGEGNDTFRGSGGVDTLYGEGGNDDLDGGSGSGTDTATDYTPSQGDTRSSIENF
jgi:Ca2+-binding RTX toxin-like protein